MNVTFFKQKIVVFSIGFAIAFTLGYYKSPEKVKIKTEIKTVVEEKIQVKTVIKESPDGERTTTIVYQNQKNSKKVNVRDVEKVSLQTNWSVSAGGGYDEYYIAIDRRLVSQLSAGLYVTVNKPVVGASVGIYLKYSF